MTPERLSSIAASLHEIAEGSPFDRVNLHGCAEDLAAAAKAMGEVESRITLTAHIEHHDPAAGVVSKDEALQRDTSEPEPVTPHQLRALAKQIQAIYDSAAQPLRSEYPKWVARLRRAADQLPDPAAARQKAARLEVGYMVNPDGQTTPDVGYMILASQRIGLDRSESVRVAVAPNDLRLLHQEIGRVLAGDPADTYAVLDFDGHGREVTVKREP